MAYSTLAMFSSARSYNWNRVFVSSMQPASLRATATNYADATTLTLGFVAIQSSNMSAQACSIAPLWSAYSALL